jgi:hypothetical protein
MMRSGTTVRVSGETNQFDKEQTAWEGMPAMDRCDLTRRCFLQSSGLLVSGGVVLGLSKQEGCEDPGVVTNVDHPPVSQGEDGVVCHSDTYKVDLMKGFPPPKDKRVTLDNWGDTTATIRWTNYNGARVFKTVPIERGDAPICVVPRQMMDRESLNRAQVSWGETASNAKKITVEEWLVRSETDGFIVLHDGCILAEQYFGHTTSATLRDLYSATKGFLASILAPFLHDCTIDVRAQVTDYIPELSTTGFAGATVRHLLDQTTGISMTFPPAEWLQQQSRKVQKEWVWASPELRHADNELARQFRAAGRFAKLPEEAADSGFFDYLLTVKQEDEHGSYFNYSAANAGVLQVILERTTPGIHGRVPSELPY